MFLAHAFGQRYELPLPLVLFVLGGAVVVVVSFLLVFRRDVADEADAALPDRPTLRTAHPAWGVLSLVALGFLVWCGLAGSQNVPENIVPTVFWLLVWIAVPLSCGLIGDWTQPVNPFAFLARLTDRPGLRRALLGGEQPLPWRLGWWPAVVLYFLAACGELVFNLTATIPHVTAIALLAYAAVSALMGLLFGAGWRERGEMFTVLLSTWGRLGYWRFGAPGRRGFAQGLAVAFEPTVSRVAFVLLLLVSVNFDGLLATPRWNALEHGLPGHFGVAGPRLETFRVLTFIVLAGLVALVFGGFASAAARAGRHRDGFRTALAGLLPSVLPIAFGYLLAHNLQYLLVNSQLLLPLIGNPPGLKSWPLHPPYPFNDRYEVHPHFLPSSVYWYVSVLVIVAVHVVAVVLAHRHLARRGETLAVARRSEYPWLVAMVAYTMLSLWLIAQPLVTERAAPKPAGAAAVSSTRLTAAGPR